MSVLSLCMVIARMCWRWSGNPLVVAVFVPALVWQTSILAMPVDDHFSTFGARDAWRRVIGYRSFPGCGGMVMCEGYAYIEYDQGFEARPMERGDYGSVPFVSVDDNPARERGIWAPTVRHYSFKRRIHLRGVGGLNEYNSIREDGSIQFSDEYFQRAIRAVAPVYLQNSKQFNPVAYRAMRSGKLEYTEPIYAGYAHNALAIFLLAMSGRGVFNLRRWWGTFRSRFRSNRNCCVACGYNLRGLMRGRCPECGVLIPDMHSEIYTERETIPGIESGVFGVASGATSGGGGHEADEDADAARGDEPEPRR